MTLPSWTREPLVHFLALGAVLYVALTWGGTPVDPASRVIEVGPEEQAQIALGFERTMGRAPTDVELDAAIDNFVREEVLYREALRLGLDQGDAVVRQRLVAKMDMSASLAAETAEPDEATLRAYFETNADRYGGEELLSFQQQFFGDEASARQAIAQGATQGQPISLPSEVENLPLREVAGRFGEEFAGNLSGVAADGEWTGPLRSGFGWHLVRLTQRRADPAGFDEMRERVLNDWRSSEVAARKQRAFEVLRGAYRVEIDR